MSNDIQLGLSFDDVLLVPCLSGVLPADIDLGTTLARGISTNIPVLSAAMDTVTEERLAIALAREGGMGVIHRNCTLEEQCEFVEQVKRAEPMENCQACKDPGGRLRVGAAIGVSEQSTARAEALAAAGCDILFIDSATGHTTRVIDLLRQLRERLGSFPVVAGNVVTEEGASDLIDAGAAAIKVGLGPGSVCTTRMVSGVGVPQFTAIQDVAKICRKKGIPMIADGGIRCSGDILKALAAGADAVMIGSLFAGTAESPGQTVVWQGKTFKEYRGMGSVKAMKNGSRDRYGQNGSGKLVAEGVEARVPYRGSLSLTVFQLMGGVRSGMGYIGAPDLKTLRDRAKFIRITPGGLKESQTHDVIVSDEPVSEVQDPAMLQK